MFGIVSKLSRIHLFKRPLKCTILFRNVNTCIELWIGAHPVITARRWGFLLIWWSGQTDPRVQIPLSPLRAGGTSVPLVLYSGNLEYSKLAFFTLTSKVIKDLHTWSVPFYEPIGRCTFRVPSLCGCEPITAQENCNGSKWRVSDPYPFPIPIRLSQK